jgi:hypothetical protein
MANAIAQVEVMSTTLTFALLGASASSTLLNSILTNTRKDVPPSSWAYFVPHHLHWERAVWIEIDREQVAPRLISGTHLLSRWKSEGAYGHNIMPEIEAAYLGGLPVAAFKRAFLVRKEDDEFHPLALHIGKLAR